jgi:hypothetical protein
MDTFLVTPKNEQELQLLTDVFHKMKIKTKLLSLEDKEDFGLAELMKEADRTQKISRELIFQKLRQ